MKITRSGMNRFYRGLLNHYNKKDKTYILPSLVLLEEIYLYGSIFIPTAIIIGRRIKIPEHNIDFFNIEYIRARKKRQGIATQFLIKFIEQNEIREINYLPSSKEGMYLFMKMQTYFQKYGIKDRYMNQLK